MPVCATVDWMFWAKPTVFQLNLRLISQEETHPSTAKLTRIPWLWRSEVLLILFCQMVVSNYLLNNYQCAHRLGQLSPLIKEVSLCGIRQLIQKLTQVKIKSISDRRVLRHKNDHITSPTKIRECWRRLGEMTVRARCQKWLLRNTVFSACQRHCAQEIIADVVVGRRPKQDQVSQYSSMEWERSHS